MNTITFYSFKGGVGRTLALANVAYDLARSGSRVLVVDFDLEAPGLDSIFQGPDSEHTRGVVDFVEEYLTATEPPDVREFIYEWQDETSDGAQIMVMPAGTANASYAQRLSAIDWVDLYERHQGFLMFEDLKAQWKARLEVDYVLIDSRTGHTDVTGICTRQLPDTLVVVFFPNDQNLKGLTKVVRDVRSEPETTGRDRIQLFFVASNLPRLDDEESILRRRMEQVEARLDTGEIRVVHHYDSLDLLERPLFTRDRPQTRLARQFRMISGDLRMANVEDRTGVLQWFDKPMRTLRRLAASELERRLRRIETVHSTDGEILFKLGTARQMFGQLNEAVTHYEQAIQTGFARPEVFLSRAETLQRLGQTDAAAESVVAVFHDSSTPFDVLHRAVELLRLSKPDYLRRLAGSQAVNMLRHEERIQLAGILDRNIDEREVAHALLSPLLQRASGQENWLEQALHSQGLAALALGNAAEADTHFRAALAKSPGSIINSFNLAMARWALTSVPDAALFRSVLRNPVPEILRNLPNFRQCMAVTRFVAEDAAGAQADLEASRSALRRRTGTEFSCWRYLNVTESEFLKDLNEIQDWIGGGDGSPHFVSRTGQLAIPMQSDDPAENQSTSAV